MHFDERWTEPWQIDALQELVRRTGHLSGEVIEIGTWQGLTAIPIAQAVAPRILHVVDHWKGSSDIPRELSDRNNFGTFVQNLLDSHTTNVCIHQQDWKEFAEEWLGYIRFIYLDAGHEQVEVENQIMSFQNHMQKGGIMAGDDYGLESVQLAVHNLFPFDKIHVRDGKLWWVAGWS